MVRQQSARNQPEYEIEGEPGRDPTDNARQAGRGSGWSLRFWCRTRIRDGPWSDSINACAHLEP